MGNYKFDFKQFSIIQEHTAMKVGTDGVLLGAWTCDCLCHTSSSDNRSSCNVLDIGTGTGLIALMIAQKLPTACIDAIEIDHDAYVEARLNVSRSQWNDRINVYESSLNGFIPNVRYDIIVTNPPFYNSTLKPEDSSRASARHHDSLPFSDIALFAEKYLSENGQLYAIYPTNFEENIMIGLVNSSLYYNRICDVFTKEGKPCKRRMIVFGKQPQNAVIKETLFIRNKDGEYSESYINLTKDYYL